MKQNNTRSTRDIKFTTTVYHFSRYSWTISRSDDLSCFASVTYSYHFVIRYTSWTVSRSDHALCFASSVFPPLQYLKKKKKMLSYRRCAIDKRTRLHRLIKTLHTWEKIKNDRKTLLYHTKIFQLHSVYIIAILF